VIWVRVNGAYQLKEHEHGAMLAVITPNAPVAKFDVCYFDGSWVEDIEFRTLKEAKAWTQAVVILNQ
jgi:hypothetical protein